MDGFFPMADKLKSWISLPIIVAAAALYLWFIRSGSFWAHNETFYTLFDDAMVSMRYAKNFALGFGLVWNPGEAPVEGYTNFLWTLWMSFLHLLPIPESKISLWVMLTGVGSLLLNLWVLRLIAIKLSKGSLGLATMTMVLVAGFYPLMYWTLRGMEVGLQVLFMSATILCSIHYQESFDKKFPKYIAVLLVLGLLIRPDTIVFSGITCLYLFLVTPNSLKGHLVIRLGGSLGGIILAQTAFRYFYYGEFLPNTFYLKMGGIGMIERVSHGWEALCTLLENSMAPLFLLGAVGFVIGKKWKSPLALYLLAVVIGQTAYSVYVGGDAWEWMGYANRYITAGTPALILLGAWGFQSAFQKLSRIPLWAPGAVLSVIILYAVNGKAIHHWQERKFHHYYDDLAKTSQAIHIRNHTKPEATVAVVWAGALPYFVNRKTIDLLGKNDPVIARSVSRGKVFHPGHTKWDYQYSLGKLKPDIITSLWMPTEQEQRYVHDLGYEALPNGMWLRINSPYVDRKGLITALGFKPVL